MYKYFEGSNKKWVLILFSIWIFRQIRCELYQGGITTELCIPYHSVIEKPTLKCFKIEELHYENQCSMKQVYHRILFYNTADLWLNGHKIIFKNQDGYRLEMRRAQAQILRKSSSFGQARIKKFPLFYSSLTRKCLKKKKKTVDFWMINLLLFHKENNLQLLLSFEGWCKM